MAIVNYPRAAGTVREHCNLDSEAGFYSYVCENTSGATSREMRMLNSSKSNENISDYLNFRFQTLKILSEKKLIQTIV